VEKLSGCLDCVVVKLVLDAWVLDALRADTIYEGNLEKSIAELRIKQAS
jgi:hypothetical protein